MFLHRYRQPSSHLTERTLRIEIVVDPGRPAPPPTLAQRVGEPRENRDVRMGDASAPRRGGRGGGRGRGGRRPQNERPKKTAEDLDAEMADYIANAEDEPAA